MIKLQKLSKLGVIPEDDENTVHHKQFLIAEGVLMSFGGLIWGTIVFLLDKKTQSTVPYGYIVLTFFNLLYFSKTKNFVFVRNFQTTISLLLPFLFQVFLGGFQASGGVMLWGMLAVAASLTYQDVKSSVFWLILYILLSIVMGIFDNAFIDWVEIETPSGVSIFLYTINIVFVAAIMFSLLFFNLVRNRIVVEQKLIIEQQKQFKERFLANMSHEIRTPINAIIGMTNLTLNSPVSPKQQQYLSGIKKSSENLLVIINDILDLSKLEAGKMELEKIHFRLSDIVQQVYFSMKLKSEEKGLSLTFNVESDVPSVVIGDPFRLNQILINLVGNAIKFTPKGEVKITVEKERNGSVKFRVIDSGVGISKDKLGLLFQNFSQADSSTTRKFGGTGLGLAISKTLIELQQGKIAVQSEEGKGSEFSFSILYESGDEKKIEVESTKIDDSTLAGIRILVAEDNDYNQIVLKDTLESLIKGVTIDIADNGKIAVEMLLSNDYDIILMDIQMPIMDGIESTKYIRTNMNEWKRNIPIVALTASILEKDISRFLAAGMNDCIPKPFTNKELLGGLTKFYKSRNGETQQKNQTQSNDSIAIEENETDLTFIKEFCEGDTTRMKKYVDLFLNGMPENLKKMEASVHNQDYVGLSKLAHTIKPQFNYMGMHKAKELSNTIENFEENAGNQEQIHLLLIQLKKICVKSYAELSEFKASN